MASFRDDFQKKYVTYKGLCRYSNMDGKVWDASCNEDFAQIYNATMPTLYKIAYRIVLDEDIAEDLSHDSLIKANEKKMRFPSLNDAKYWLIRVTKNNAFNYVKRLGRERKALNRVLYEGPKHASTGETEYLKGESIKMVQEALKSMNEKLKEVVILKIYGDLNYKEIGKVLGISEGNVKVRIFRARKILQEKLGVENVFMPN